MTWDLLPYAIGQLSGYEPAPHLCLLAEKLEAVARGTCQRLMVFMPPRHGKSYLASQAFPAWWMGLHPDRYIIAASHTQTLADEFGRKVRNLLADPRHGAMFPSSRLSEDSKAADRFHTTKGGTYFGVGVGGAIAGRGAHLLLIDDPIRSREDAESETMRSKLKNWYAADAYTRLMPGAAIVVIQTRWHQDDLAGWLLSEHAHEGWDVVNLPARAEPEDALGREEGAPLWPERYDAERLDAIRRAVGAREWNALYQQRPSAAEGTIFKREYWQNYKPSESSPAALLQVLGVNHVVQAWDTAFKTKETNDFSACVTIGVARSRYYVLDVWRDRAEFPDLKRAMVAQQAKWKAHSVVVEDTAAGQSLLQELRRNTRMPLVAVKADRDKVTRAHAVTPTHEAGLCYLPEEEPWVADFEDELAGFPGSAHDDQVDAFVYAMTYALNHTAPVAVQSSSQPIPIVSRWK